MTTTLKSLIEELSPEDQQFVEEKAERLAQDMISHADSLAQVRTAFLKTQDEVARILNVKQNAVAQLEKRSDLLLSTLRKYVEAMGGELAVAVRTRAGNVIMLDSLSSLAQISESADTPSLKRPRSPSVSLKTRSTASRSAVKPLVRGR
ncbi:helix-turn-helix domain-containing protein [Roseateles depolymerans]|uniref:Helix-turn-helix protein n=1 Tax=Roseateles depolymerans TaxID=76731 RepID=A0A0U3CJK7_9BURK|nr:helix-turn-helix transcriptional regulator [Roseateles depolymerans]ALV08792.1 Helix-turn-helix protein [Roseateles depolymerans]REG20978.1 helix-turn-helix protein [Roseateles depolymerans]